MRGDGLDTRDAAAAESAAAAPGGEDSAAALVVRWEGELRELARHLLASERLGHTLQPTALVNELWLRLAARTDLQFGARAAFVAYAAAALRSLLVDHARRREADRRGGGRIRCELKEDQILIVESAEGSRWGYSLIELDEELRLLAKSDPVSAEAFELRYFGGMSVGQVADRIGLSTRRIQDYTEAARRWLRDRLDGRARP